MVAILTASMEPELTEFVLMRYLGQDYSKEILSKYTDPRNVCVIAVEDGVAVGLAGCRSGADNGFLVDMAFTLDEAPEGTFEMIMRSVLSIAQNSGLESVDVHAPDPDGRNAGLCYRMGFEDSGPCTCCQRTDLIHMAFRF